MPAHDPEHRAAAARVAATQRWANLRGKARTAATAAARERKLDLLKDQVDPERLLPPDELQAAIDQAIKIEMAELGRRAAAARAARRQQKALDELVTAEAEIAELTGADR